MHSAAKFLSDEIHIFEITFLRCALVIVVLSPIIFKEGKVIKSDFCRHPIEPLNLNTRNELLRIAKNYDLVALNWGK